jgi:hypothetical protein
MVWEGGPGRSRRSAALLGWGKAIATRPGREGADVATADVNCPAGDVTRREMCAVGFDARSAPCDARDSSQVKIMVKQVLGLA